MTPFQCVIITDSLSPRSQRETAFEALAKDVGSLTRHSVENTKLLRREKNSSEGNSVEEFNKNSGTLFPSGGIDSHYL